MCRLLAPACAKNGALCSYHLYNYGHQNGHPCSAADCRPALKFGSTVLSGSVCVCVGGGGGEGKGKRVRENGWGGGRGQLKDRYPAFSRDI